MGNKGVFIFIIFICKKKICRDLLRKCKVFVPRSISSLSLHTQSTTTSGTSNKVLNTDTEKEKI
ncbi:hypothetical protein NQ314_013205 [Rhamnusium bicolor]|uniref:Uncharacterized protein n=1 Tax=Rhamnusium bicolor TaxID=1586634 RepID=A0AAV8X898_9CUCU|nr:hypothetical protein NQ314_013205 [Rhamnusium bicolor]